MSNNKRGIIKEKKNSFTKGIPENLTGCGNSFDDKYPISISYYDIEEELKHLVGKVLTFVDMAILDKQANKAWKDTIKQEFWKSIGRYQNICSSGQYGQSVSLEPNENNQLR